MCEKRKQYPNPTKPGWYLAVCTKLNCYNLEVVKLTKNSYGELMVWTIGTEECYKVSDFTWYSGKIHSVRSIKPKNIEFDYPWHTAPEWATCAVTNWNGFSHWLAAKPICHQNPLTGRHYWVFSDIKSQIIDVKYPIKNYQNSLQERPKQ